MSLAPLSVRVPGNPPPGYSASPRTRVKGPGIRTHTGAGDTIWQPMLNLYNKCHPFNIIVAWIGLYWHLWAGMKMQIYSSIIYIYFGNKMPYINGTLSKLSFAMLSIFKLFSFQKIMLISIKIVSCMSTLFRYHIHGIYFRGRVPLVGPSEPSRRREVITVVVFCIMMAAATVVI